MESKLQRLLKEVIEYAGGITRDADISKINYNELIKTEKTINIKSYEIDDSIVVDVYNTLMDEEGLNDEQF